MKWIDAMSTVRRIIVPGRRVSWPGVLAWASLSTVVACGGDASARETGGTEAETETENSGTQSDGESELSSSAESSTSVDADASSEDTGDSDGPGPDMMMDPVPEVLGCLEPVPPGVPVPPGRPSYPGTCPTLVPGYNTIPTLGGDREFILVLPTEIDDTKPMPLFVMWHWLGGSADGFVETGLIQEAADLWHFAAIVPEADDDLIFKWPFTALDGDNRVDRELAFFDDMVDCVSQQFTINESCISTGGVSAGALWSAVLANRRGVFLSSIVSLSGGVRGDTLATEALNGWGGSPHKMPFFVLWGGPGDFCVAIDFDEASRALGEAVAQDGHFTYECIHNCTHAEPPFDAPEGTTRFFPMWRFMLDHPYWLQDGDSPYLHSGEPDGMPEWCGIGYGSATIREGMCGGSQCM